MKTHLLLFLLFSSIGIYSCKKDSSEPLEGGTGFKVSIWKKYSLSTGESERMKATILSVRVWKIGNNDVVIKSSSDALSGYAYNNTISKSVNSDYLETEGFFKHQCEPGRYLIFVMTSEQGQAGNGKFSYSDTTFNVVKGKITEVTKDFGVYSIPGYRENWIDN